MRWLDCITDSMDMSLKKLIDREAWHAAIYGFAKSQTSFIFTFKVSKKNNTFCWNHSELCNVGGTDAEAEIPIFWLPNAKN